MLVLFCRAAGITSIGDEHPAQLPADQPMEDVVREFCQVLVDYIAAGHFTLYERIANGQERRKSVKDVAAAVYRQLEDTTQAALDFNDCYQDPAATSDLARLSDHLSKLGEQLALRIELEDRLLLAIDPNVAELR